MNFSSVCGHNKNIDFLKKLFFRDRLPHALLFSGPAGVGKRRVAAALAAFLNCLNPDEKGACGECSNCRKLSSGNQAMVRFVGSSKDEEEMNIQFKNGSRILLKNTIAGSKRGGKKKTRKINIDQIREVIRQAALKPFSDGMKVFIIDDVAQASIEAVNSLLKVLEEPPRNTFFILITSKKALLLPTVVSRCQGLEFSFLKGKEMHEYIDNYIEPGKKQAAESCVEAAGGSPGKLLELMEADSADFKKTRIENFFEEVDRWCGDSATCQKKLAVMLEKEALRFRDKPDRESCRRVTLIDDAIEAVKKNANPSLAVSNLFLQLGKVDL